MIEDIIVRATKDQLKEFINSLLWKDIKRELGRWKMNAVKEYGKVIEECVNSDPSVIKEQVISDRPNTATVLLRLGVLHGRESTIDYLISLPSVFLQELEDKSK